MHKVRCKVSVYVHSRDLELIYGSGEETRDTKREEGEGKSSRDRCKGSRMSHDGVIVHFTSIFPAIPADWVYRMELSTHHA